MNNQLTTTNQNYISENEITIIPAEKSIIDKLNNYILQHKVEVFLLKREDIDEVQFLTGKSDKFKNIPIRLLTKGYKSVVMYDKIYDSVIVEYIN